MPPSSGKPTSAQQGSNVVNGGATDLSAGVLDEQHRVDIDSELKGEKDRRYMRRVVFIVFLFMMTVALVGLFAFLFQVWFARPFYFVGLAATSIAPIVFYSVTMGLVVSIALGLGVAIVRISNNETGLPGNAARGGDDDAFTTFVPLSALVRAYRDTGGG